jgi:hypothetical protein
MAVVKTVTMDLKAMLEARGLSLSDIESREFRAALRSYDIRKMIADRGWTEQIEHKARLLVHEATCHVGLEILSA